MKIYIIRVAFLPLGRSPFPISPSRDILDIYFWHLDASLIELVSLGEVRDFNYSWE